MFKKQLKVASETPISAKDRKKLRQDLQEQFDREKKGYGTWPTNPSAAHAPAATGSSRGTGGSSLASTRAALLKQAPLTADRNPLLGRWAQPDSSQTANAGLAGQIESMLGGATCSTLFGRDPVEFRPDAMVVGGTRATAIPAQYRAGQGHNVFVLPQRGIELILIEMQGRDQAQVTAGSACKLRRIANPVAVATPSEAAAAATPVPPAPQAPAGATGAVFDGAGFRCTDGGLYHVTGCQGSGSDTLCQLTELHRKQGPLGWPPTTSQRRDAIAARVQSCEAGGFHFDGRTPIFVH